MAVKSEKGKASIAKAAASHAAQVASKKPGDNKSTKGLGTIQAESMGLPSGTTVAGGFALDENQKSGTQAQKVDSFSAPTTAQPDMRPYQIKEGDTLSKIAQEQGADMESVLKANPNITDPNKIQAGSQLNVPNRFKQGFQQAQAGGMPAPVTAGEGMSMVGKFTPPTPIQEQITPVEQTLQQDPGWKAIQDRRKEYEDELNQRTSLTDEYKKLTKQAGIPEINTELINMKTVIEGTEDDIRAEVTASSGFATDSQVMALAASRNKQLIKNYNTLLDTKTAQMDYINQMMGFAQQDRQNAQQSLQMRMQFDEMENNYRDKFTNNAKEGYNNIISQLGYDGLYKSLQNDPYTLSIAEKTLGLGSGQLAQLASQPNLDRQMKEAQLQTERLQQDKIRADMNGTNENGTINGKPQNASQSSANSYANRMAEANIALTNLGNKFTGKLSQVPTLNFLKSSDRQVYEQAQKNFVTAVLRRESGASIAPSEFDTARDVYFPKPGDTPEVVKEKEATRNTVINNFYREANVLRPVLPGQVIQGDDGKQYKVELDGETLTEI